MHRPIKNACTIEACARTVALGSPVPRSAAPLPALAIVEQDGPHAVAFPCRRVVGAWIAAENNKWTEVRRTGVVFAGKNELRHIRRASSSVSCCLNMGGSHGMV